MPTPLLWHLPISHFSEKVRWALDWKRIPHRRRIMPPGLHPLGGLVLTGGRQFTMPVLVAEGQGIGDSTAIIEWLEERFRERPLYPADPDSRARALELEDWFDENLGPYARQWGFNALLTEPEAVRAFAVKADRVGPVRRAGRSVRPVREGVPGRALLDGRRCRGGRRAGKARRRARQARGRAGGSGVPGRRPLFGCRPDRRRAVLSTRRARRGSVAAAADGRVPRVPGLGKGAPRLPLGRGHLPPPPPRHGRLD